MMENDLELQEQEDSKYRFRPFSLQFSKAHEWDGATQDLKWLWPWIKPMRTKLFFALLLFITATLVTLTIPKIVAKIVDEVLVKKNQPFTLWATIFVSSILFKIIADISYKWMVTKIGQNISRTLRSDIFYQLGKFPLSFFDKNASGRLISRCVNDVTNLSSFFTVSFFTVIADFALITGAVLFILTLSPWTALLVVSSLVPLTIFMLNVSQAQMRWGRDQRNTLSRLSSHTADTMNNLSILHSQSFSYKWSDRHARLQKIFSGYTIRNILTWGSFSSSHVVVMGITYSSVVTLGVYQLKNGQISMGNLIASFSYVSLIFGPFIEISEKLNVMVTALGSVKRLRHLLPHKIEQDHEIPADLDFSPSGNIVFDNITFSYRQDTNLFSNFSLELPEGEVTALVGRTGSGKTTLAHLMLGLYPLNAGRILWGKEDITHLNSTRRARWISHVSQDLFIFTDTIRENLRMWREEITDEMIWNRLKLVGLQEKIMKLEGRLDMIVKAETLPLSQGEKQLLLLCRALLQDPKLLVFDEATANLDQLTEEDWLNHISTLFEGRTTLFIAHRMETLRLATNIVVLENGVVKKTFRKAKGAPITAEDLH